MFVSWNPLPLGAPMGAGEAASNEPLMLSFPQCLTESPHDPSFSKNVHQLFKQIRKLPDITPEHLECLNVSVEYDVPLDNFLPAYPPKPHTNPSLPETTSSTVVPLVPAPPAPAYLPDENGEGRRDKTFSERKKELELSNDLAFQGMQRIRRDIKLGHFYRFYHSLELVVGYYNPKDCAFTGMPERFREELVKNFIEPICWGYNTCLLPPRAAPKVQYQKTRFMTRLDFFGYVNPVLQAERKLGIVEGPLFAIQCRHEDHFVYPGGPQCREDSPPPSPPPRDEVLVQENPKSPVSCPDEDTPMKEGASTVTTGRDSSIRNSSSSDNNGDNSSDDSTSKNSQEVPSTTGKQLELETAEGQEQEQEHLLKLSASRLKAAKRNEEQRIRIKKGSWPQGDVWDVLKEVGGLLCTAQERRKGGKGADGVGRGKVEKRTRYRAVGRESTWWDDIFLISSVHRHISFTHVHIAAPYLHFLEKGNLPNPNHELIKDEKSEWCDLKMRKSRWFDLGNPNDRVEAAKLTSGVLAFLLRNEDSS